MLCVVNACMLLLCALLFVVCNVMFVVVACCRLVFGVVC